MNFLTRRIKQLEESSRIIIPPGATVQDLTDDQLLYLLDPIAPIVTGNPKARGADLTEADLKRIADGDYNLYDKT